MNFRFTAILFGAVVAGIAALALVTYFDDDKAGSDGLAAPFAKVGLKESDVDTVELLRSEPAEERLVFSKGTEGKWELRQPVVAKVDSFAVESIVKMLFSAKPTRYPGLTSNTAQYGLAKPTLKITLKRGTDTTATVNIGNTTIGGSDAFTFASTAEHPDRPIALRAADLRPLVRESAVGKDGEAWTLAKWLTDFRARRLLGSEGSNPDSGMETLALKRGAATLKLTRGPDGSWKFEEPAGFGDADTAGDTNPRPDLFTGVRPLLNALVTLQPAGVGDYIEGVKATDWAKYGLAENDPTAIRVDVKSRGSAGSETLLIGKKVEKDGRPVLPTKVYCRLLGDSAAILVQTDRTDALAATIANPSDMRNKDLIPEGRKELIDALDISQGESTFKLRRIAGGSGSQWAIYGGAPEGRWATTVGPTDPNDARASVSKLLDALAKPRAAKAVLSSSPPDAFAKTTASLKVWYNGLPANSAPVGDSPPAEPAVKGEPAALFQLGKVEADLAFLKRTAAGASVDFQIPLELVAALLRPRLDYVDPRAGTFQPVGVTKLGFNRGAEVYELIRAPAPERGGLNRYEFARPEVSKGKGADTEVVQQLLGQLAALQTAKLITDSPTPDELTRWGLATPRLKATVTLDKAPERSYEFGGETDDKKGVYFRVAGKPFAFVAPKELYDLYAGADLRDRTLFRYDPNKVKRLDITAWKNASPTGKPFDLKLERQGLSWVALEPKDFPVDPAKVAGLLMALESPRAVEFVPGFTPEMGLDVESGAFQIVIVPESGPAALLRIGREDTTKKYLYALGSTFEGVVKIDASLFRNYVELASSLRR